MKRCLIALIIYSLTATGFYFWMHGSEGAARLTQFWLWAWALLALFAAWHVLANDAKMPARFPVLVSLGRVYGAAVLVLLVWNGCPVLACVYALAWLLMAAARYTADEAAKATAS